jgi:hypothetical protein
VTPLSLLNEEFDLFTLWLLEKLLLDVLNWRLLLNMVVVRVVVGMRSRENGVVYTRKGV